MVRVTHRRRFGAGLAAVIMITAGCEQGGSTEPAVNAHANHAVVAAASPLGSDKGGLVTDVHAAVARFHSTKQAERAGYAADPVCVEVPGLGGMGHHWVNTALVDPVFDPTNPEVVLYAPDRHGKMKLIAVEYIVINTGQPRPAFQGHQFDVGGTPVPAAHWSLHVWLGEPNPSGVFAPFNPNIDCP